MASITAGPTSGTIALSDCVAWKITGTYNSNPDEQTVLLWRLLCDGVPVTGVQSAALGFAGEQIPVNFTQEADCLLSTKIPDCNSPTQVINADEAVKEFTLECGEITVTKEDCEERIDPEDLEGQLSEGATVMVLNTYINAWDDDQNVDSGGLIMSSRPLSYALCPCSCDWLYTYDRPLISYRICRASINGVQDFLQTGGGGSGESVIGYPAGLCQVAEITGVPLSDIKWIELNFGGEERYRVYRKICKCEDEDCRFDLYFLEPLGGISLFCMECIDSIAIQQEGTVICLSDDCFDTAQNNAQKYGQQYLGKGNWCQITSTVDRRVSSNTMSFFKALGASTRKYTKMPGTNFLGGFMVAPGSVPTFNKDEDTTITITGLIASGIKAHFTN